MSKNGLMGVAKSLQKTIVKHSPEILTGLGILGLFSAGALAVAATPKAMKKIEEAKEERGGDLKPTEVVKVTWKCYVPAAVTGVLSASCIIGASSVNFRRNAALATAYTLSEAAMKEYQEKVVAEIGEKKEESVRNAIAQDRLNANPVTNREVIITDKGNTLCMDVITRRYFRIDVDKLKKIVNDLNRRMRDEMYISLNEFYYEIGLEGIPIGDDLGWNIDRGYIDLDLKSGLATDDTPCLVVDYHIEPRYEYK